MICRAENGHTNRLPHYRIYGLTADHHQKGTGQKRICIYNNNYNRYYIRVPREHDDGTVMYKLYITYIVISHGNLLL